MSQFESAEESFASFQEQIASVTHFLESGDSLESSHEAGSRKRLQKVRHAAADLKASGLQDRIAGPLPFIWCLLMY